MRRGSDVQVWVYASPVLTLVITLTIAGLVLSIAGVYWGARRSVKEFRKLKRDLAKLESIQADESLPAEERNQRRLDYLYPTGTWGHIEYHREYTRFAVLSLAIEDLKWPAAMTAGGILLGSLGSLLSLWA